MKLVIKTASQLQASVQLIKGNNEACQWQVLVLTVPATQHNNGTRLLSTGTGGCCQCSIQYSWY